MDGHESIQSTATTAVHRHIRRRTSDDDGDGGMIGRALIYAVIVIVGLAMIALQRFTG